MTEEISKEITTAPKETKINVQGLGFYGAKFTRFQKIAEVISLIPAFKQFYYEKRIEDPTVSMSWIAQKFNTEVCEPMNKIFHPPFQTIAAWRKKWDLELSRDTNQDLTVFEQKNISQAIKTRDERDNLILGAADDNQLEAGVRTLGGELLNDAFQMLRDDQALEEIYTNDELMRRRNYIVNVFAHATKLVHGKAALLLKASEEKRNTAGFLMNLLAKATAGKMSDEEMDLLKSAYVPKQNERQTQ